MIVARIVETGLSLPHMKKKFVQWEMERNLRPAHTLIAKTAAKVGLEKERGQGFSISVYDLDKLGLNRSDETFKNLFNSVTADTLKGSDSLKCFVDAFGYKMTCDSSGSKRFIDGAVTGHKKSEKSEDFADTFNF